MKSILNIFVSCKRAQGLELWLGKLSLVDRAGADTIAEAGDLYQDSEHEQRINDRVNSFW